MKTGWISLIFLLSLTLGSCTISQAGVEKAPELPTLEPETIPSKNSTEPPLQLERTPPDPTEMASIPPVEKFAALAKQDLASRLGVDADKIKVVKFAEKL